jgi:hypothetical protein
VNSKRLRGIDTSKQRSFSLVQLFVRYSFFFDKASVLGKVLASFQRARPFPLPCGSDSSSVAISHHQIGIRSVDQMMRKSNHPMCHVD